MNSWQKHLPEFTLKEWNETNSPLDNDYCKEALDKKLWSKVSNYVRLWAIYHEGGIYLDTDFEITKNLNPLLVHKSFLGFQRVDENIGWVNNAIIGAEKGIKFYDRCIQKTLSIYKEEGLFALSPNITTLVLREMGLEHYGYQIIDGVTLFPIEYFYPYSWLQEFSPGCIKEQTFAIHHWNHSWNEKTKLGNYPKKSKLKNMKFRHPGSWIFDRRVLWWFKRAELFSQLPFIFRMFGWYAKYFFKHSDKNYLKGGRRLFLFITFLNRELRLKSYAKIKIFSDYVCLDLQDPRFLAVVNELLDPKPEFKILSDLLNEGDTFIDVGANHGSFSLQASKLVGKSGIVLAIEPQLRKTETIQNTLKWNNYSPFRVYQTAIGNVDSEALLLIPKDTSGDAGVFKKFSGIDAHRTQRISVKRFDDLFEKVDMPGKVVIKIDIEGSEYAFLDGARECIAKLRPLLIIEINPRALRAAGITNDVFKKLIIQLGYRQFILLKDDQQEFKISELNTDIFQNILLIP